MFLVVLLLLSTFFNKPQTATAAASTTMNFQARLLQSSGALVQDGNYHVEFKLYASSVGGSALWTETYTSSNRVRVANGYLTVNLGSLTPFPGNINWDQELWLTMNVGGNGPTAVWDGEMTPRLKLTAVPHAFTASKLQQTNGANTSTLGFAAQTGSRSILLPDESGTICLQGSSNCGFVTGSASSFLQNSVSPQTADFNITGSGAIGTNLTVGGNVVLGASSVLTLGGDTNLYRSAANTLKTDDSLVVSGNLESNGTVLFKNSSNSATAFQIQNASGSVLFNANTQNMRIGIGTASAQTTLHLYGQGTNGAGTRIAFGDYDGGNQNVFIGEYSAGDSDQMHIQGRDGIVFTTGASANNVNFGIDYNGAAYFQPSVDNAYAFLMVGADEGEYLRVDSLNKNMYLGNTLLSIDTYEWDGAGGYVINNGISNAGNEMPNNSFESDITSLNGRSGYYGSASTSAIITSPLARTGERLLRVNATGSGASVDTGKAWILSPGETIYFRGWVRTANGTNGEGGFFATCYDKYLNTPEYYPSDWTNPGTSWAPRMITVTGSSSCVYVFFTVTVRTNSTTGTWYFDDLYVSSANSEYLQVQNADGHILFAADTENMQVSVSGVLSVKGVNNPAPPTLTRTSGGSLANGTTYRYAIAAIAPNGKVTSAIPSSPESLTTNGANRTMNLSWSAVTGATGYRIYRSVDGGSTWYFNDVASNVTNIVDNGTNFTWTNEDDLSWWNSTGGIDLGDNNLLYFSEDSEVFMGYSSRNKTLAITNWVPGSVIWLQADYFGLSNVNGDAVLYIDDIGRTYFQNVTDSTTAFQIQRSNGNNVLTADTSNTRVLIGSATTPSLSSAQLVVTVAEIQTTLRVGSATNGISFNDSATGESGKLRFYGSARNTKRITLTPEYVGAVLEGTGTGSMTSGHDLLSRQNYYRWTSSQGTLQCYSVVVSLRLPTDWDGWANNAFSINRWSSNTGDTSGLVTVVEADGGTTDINNVDINASSNSTWQTYSTNLTSNQYAADDKITVYVQMCARNNANFQIGDITLTYLSKF